MTNFEIRLSGKVAALRDDVPVALPGKRARALLVLLALSAGRAVPVDTLARGIWGDYPPERVRGSLQTYVGRLRQAIGTNLVVTESAGYRLDLPPDAVDLLRFERLVARASDASDPAAEGARLDEALSLWAGDPFGDAPSEWIEQQLVPEISERHLQVVERRIDLDIRNGDGLAHLPQLRNLIERHPLRETLWMYLLTALDQAGRTAEALERYEALRERLADELGIDPSPDLQRVHLGLLSADISQSKTESSARTTGPRQLPRPVAGFVGRSEQLTALDSLVAEHDSTLIALHGPGGVGKTSLAVHWATRRPERFPDGQLFVDLRGYGPGEPVEALEALDVLLRGLDVPGSQIPSDIDARSALLRTELSGRKALVALDNARDAAQVRPLLAGGSTTTIVTSRSQLRGLVAREGARRVAVEPMPTDEAVELLADRFAVPYNDHARELADLAELCGCLPVALTVAAERAGRHGIPRIADVTERLRDEHDRLESLTDWADDPLTDVRAVFSWSYHALDFDTARMFRLLGCHPDSRVAGGAAAALAGIDDRAAEGLLDRLTDRHLLTEVSLGWYEMHDLARAYASELVEHDSEREIALCRLRSWYLHSASNAGDTHATPPVTYTIPEPLPDVAPARFDSVEQATDWFVAHRHCIRSLLRSAAADGDDETVARLTPRLFRFYNYVAAHHEAADLLTLAQQCARRADDRLVEALCAHLLGGLLKDLDQLTDSIAQYEAACALFAKLEHESGRLSAELSLGSAYSSAERFEDAIETINRAVRDTRPEDARLSALGLNNLADIYMGLDRVPEAVTAAQQAVDIAASGAIFDEANVAVCYVTLGEAQFAAAQWDAAVTALSEAVELFDSSGWVAAEILARQLRGKVRRDAGAITDARKDWRAALDMLDGLARDQIPNYGVAGTGQREELNALLAELPPTSRENPSEREPIEGSGA